jgi:hypothetical protein
LCHSKEDSAFVRNVAYYLDQVGVRPWFDEWEIAPGDSLFEKIGVGIQTSGVFCPIVSEYSVKSKWCAVELNEALYANLELKNLKIAPMRLRGAEMPVFLRSKRYLNPDKDLFGALLEIVALAFDISMKNVSMLRAEYQLNSFQEFRFSIDRLRKSDKKIFGKEDWEILSKLLLRQGISIGNEIEILDRLTGIRHHAS